MGQIDGVGSQALSATVMRSPILNREFQHPADGWYQIEVPGEHPSTGGAVLQVIDGVAVNHIVNTFNREAADYRQVYGVDFPGMLIDHEHFKYDTDKETRAYGWLLELENRQGKPFGRINWTITGKAATDGGDYRFFSTEYDLEDLQIINRNTTPPRVRPLRLAGLTLTNNPNNKGGAPITNRGTQATGFDNLSPAQAGARVLAEANLIKVQTGCPFDRAWNQVRHSQPALFNRMYKPNR